ncbi:MAG: GH3 auxin-responsive promoter family protein [Ferruginibacter sp.]
MESSILDAAAGEWVRLVEFTVAPFVSSDNGKSYHEWFIEFEGVCKGTDVFANAIEENLRKKSVYYKRPNHRTYPRPAENNPRTA